MAVMGEISVGVQQIYIEEMGAGAPVLLLHSSGMGARQWRRLAGGLSAQYHVFAPDLIGYGKSGPWRGEGDFHYRGDLEVAEAIALNAGAPVHLVGHSYGGFLALLMAAAGRVPVASVAVYEPVAFGVLQSTGDEEGLKHLKDVDQAGDFFAPALEGTETWCERFVDFWGGVGYWARLPAPMKEIFLASGVKMFHEVQSLIYDQTPHEHYAGISAPTLLMKGTTSPLPELHVVEILARTIPGARLVTIEGAGHMGPLTHSARVDRLIGGHIGQASGA